MKRFCARGLTGLAALSAMHVALAVSAGGDMSYDGFSMSALTSPMLTPFRETTQDLDAVLEANALASQQSLTNNQASFAASAQPFIVTIPGPSSTSPQIQATSLGLQALATNMGLTSTPSVTIAATTDYLIQPGTTTSSSKLWGNAATAQTVSPTGVSLSSAGILTLDDSQGVALAPFNVASIMTPEKYNKVNAQMYLALVSGASTPVSGILQCSNFSGSSSAQNCSNYYLGIAREAAVQSAAVTVLQDYATKNAPMAATLPASLGQHFVNTGLTPSINNISRYMAARRLDPANGWYNRVAQGSSLELQRESLYLQAEALYELNQVHQSLQQNNLLVALNLIEQSRSNTSLLNQTAQMQNSQSGFGASAAPTMSSSTSSTSSVSYS